VNQTLSQYTELRAEHLALMQDGRIDSRSALPERAPHLAASPHGARIGGDA
jgi:hypothetical protein